MKDNVGMIERDEVVIVERNVIVLEWGLDSREAFKGEDHHRKKL